MKHIRSILLICSLTIFLATNGITQSKYQEILLNIEPNSQHKINEDSLTTTILNRFPEEVRSKHERLATVVSRQSARSIKRELAGPEIYNNWGSIELYMNKIVEQLLGDQKGLKTVKTVLTRSGAYNASMNIAGIMTVNTGLFTYVQNEAELAAVLAHELAHHLLEHNLEYHIQSITKLGYGDYGFLGSKFKERREMLQSHELAADSFALKLLTDAGYSVKGMKRNLDWMEFLERKHTMLNNETDKVYIYSHPLSIDRTNAFKDHLSDYPTTGKNYIVDSLQFLRNKYYSEIEAIRSDLLALELNEALEKSFRLHLKQPMNEVYYYYLLESIRRLCATNQGFWNANFISYRYFESESMNIVNLDKKPKVEHSIGEKYDARIVGFTEEELNNTEGNYYWKAEVPYFKTNSEAFDFFFKMSQNVNCRECIFSNAMSFTEEEKRDEELKTYLSKPGIANSELAQHLLDEKLNQSFEEKKLVVLLRPSILFKFINDDLNFVVSQRYNEPSRVDSLFKVAVSKSPNSEPLIMNEILYSDFSDFIKLSEISRLAFLVDLAEGDGLNLLELFPEFYPLFKKYNSVNIEFMFIQFFRLMRGSDFKSLEGYENLMEQYEEDIYQNGLTQYFNIGLTDIYKARVVPRNANKFFYWEDVKIPAESEEVFAERLYQAILNLESAKPGVPKLLTK